MTSCRIVNNSAGIGLHGGNGGGGVISIGESGTANLTSVIVTGNNAGDGYQGQGVGEGGWGGGLAVGAQNFAVVTMTNSTISGNGTGGGGYAGGRGGGMYTGTSQALNIIASTISNNFTRGANTLGGGIYNGYSITMINSTVSGNHTDLNTGQGGGIYNYHATLWVFNSTITGNSAYTSGSLDNGQGIANVGYATGPLVPKIANTIIAGNGNGSVPDVTGYFSSQGYNLIGRATFENSGGVYGDESGFMNGSNGDQVGSLQSPMNALLGPLANNGGPTQTHLLLPGSPGINAGNPAFVPPPETDQRGFPRVVGSRSVRTAKCRVYAYSNTDAHSNADAHSCTNADADPNSNADSDDHAHANADANADSDTEDDPIQRLKLRRGRRRWARGHHHHSFG